MKTEVHSFKQGLLIYFVTAIVIVVIALLVFWKFLGSFEDSRPNLTAEAFMTNVDDAFLEDLVMNSQEMFPTTEFEDSAVIAAQCFEAVRGLNISIRRRSGNHADIFTEEAPAYTIRKGGSDMAVLKLSESGDAGFGYNTWEVATVTLAEEFVPDTRIVTIIAPGEALITINGVSLTKEYESGWEFYEKLSDLEKQFDNAYKTSTYRIEGIYSNLELSAVMPDGEILEPTVADGSRFVYERIAAARPITIQVSSADILSICGVVIPGEYITEEAALPRPDGVEEYIGDFIYPCFRTYVIPGIYAEELLVQAENNGGIPAEAMTQENGIYSFGWSAEKITEEREAFLSEYAEQYIRYASNVGNSVDRNWENFGGYLLYDSDLYDRMVEFMDGLSWMKASECELKSCEVLNYLPCGEECFLARVRLEYSVTRRSGTREESPTFDLFFVWDEGSYRAALMNIVE